jgi:hypothetical protein
VLLRLNNSKPTMFSFNVPKPGEAFNPQKRATEKQSRASDIKQTIFLELQSYIDLHESTYRLEELQTELSKLNLHPRVVIAGEAPKLPKLSLANSSHVLNKFDPKYVNTKISEVIHSGKTVALGYELVAVGAGRTTNNIIGGFLKIVKLIKESMGIGNSPVASSTASVGLGILDVSGMIIGGLQMLIIPFIYLNAYIDGRKVPFNVDNNKDLLLGVAYFAVGITFTLVTTVAATTAGPFIFAALAMFDSVFDFVRTKMARTQAKQALADSLLVISSLETTLANHTQKRIQTIAVLNATIKAEYNKPLPDMSIVQMCYAQLNQLALTHEHETKALKSALVKHEMAKIDEFRASNPFSHHRQAIRVALAITSIAAAILLCFPLTAPAGIVLAVIAGVIATGLFIAHSKNRLEMADKVAAKTAALKDHEHALTADHSFAPAPSLSSTASAFKSVGGKHHDEVNPVPASVKSGFNKSGTTSPLFKNKPSTDSGKFNFSFNRNAFNF